MANSRPKKPAKNHFWRSLKIVRTEPGVSDFCEVRSDRFKKVKK